MHQSQRRILGVVFAALCLAAPASAEPFGRLVVFGDSLSDTGNAYDALGSLAQDPDDYYDGRFSNGPVWVEYLAQQLQLPHPTANLIDTTQGRNYAFGGAWTDGSGFVQLFINDIDEQVSDYLNNDGGPAGDELFVLLGGANDFFEGQTDTQAPVNNLRDDITRLYNAGARRFMVSNLPLLGQTPRYKGTGSEATFDARSAQFNSQLHAALDTLELTLPGVSFYRIDAAQLIADAVTDPGRFGFTNVTDEAYQLTGIDADQYLFWDNVHPTTRAHSLLADSAAATLFEALYSQPGDLDLDGFVGVDDLNLILTNWNQAVPAGNPLFADATGDGFVGVDDLNILLTHWNAGAPPAEGLIALPEPGTGLLLLFVGAAMLKRGG